MSTILDLFKLDGKVAVVTGAARGLGQGMALALAEAGADIVAVDILPADDTVKQVKALGRKAVAIVGNLGDRAAIPQVITDAKKHFTSLDILVNCAGIIRRADFVDFTEKDWDDVLQVNLKAVFFLSQAVARVFIEQGGGGKIINIASMLSYQGGILIPSYTAAKSGLAGITRSMANEWAAKGINVNAIAPGYFDTRVTKPLQNDEVRNKAILDRIPAGRWGKPSELGGMAVFLASSASDYCHGSIYPIDGGWLSR